MGKFIHIKSNKFPILAGEEEEIVNEGMYGKALAEYLQLKLSERGYEAPFICAEDWGWWVALKGQPFSFGVCIYASSESRPPNEFVCTDSVNKPRKWSWSKFRFIDTAPTGKKLEGDLIEIFNADDAVEIRGVTEEFPF